MEKKPLTNQTFISGDRIPNHFASQENGRLLGIKEAAKYLGLSIWTVRGLVWSGELPIVRFGARRQYLDIRDLDMLIERNKIVYQ